MSARWQHFHHGADVGVRGIGSTLAQAFEQAALALTAVVTDPATVKRVVLCSGKVYYDLCDARREQGAEGVALIRLEQLYPFPEVELEKVLAPFTNMAEVVWCQEEPMNQGAWYSSQHHMRRVVQRLKPGTYLNYAGRDASAAPAAGYMALHLSQMEKFIKEALGVGA